MSIDQLTTIHPVILALCAGIFTWSLTALGASVVFLTKKVNKKFLHTMLGFAAGIMVAASFWSLLAPCIKMSREMGVPAWLPACVGFLSGCFFLRIADKFIPHLHLDQPIDHAEGVKTNWKRTTLLVVAVTLHNIPEGLALGVAFGAIASDPGSATMASAIALTIGIGLQNFPEGMAISLPLRAGGFSKIKSFFIGQLSGIVEPLAAVIGALIVFIARPILPYALAFAAGAMLFVVVEELIPESQSEEHGDIATIGFILGFTVMMFLDVALG
jgi:zinc transporter, ZIP family